MKIITVAPKVKENPFAADVAALVQASETRPDAAGAFEVPTAEASKAKFKIAKAAHAHDRTASLYSEETSGKNGETTTLVYRIKAKHQSKPRGPRKPKAEETSAE